MRSSYCCWIILGAIFAAVVSPNASFAGDMLVCLEPNSVWKDVRAYCQTIIDQKNGELLGYNSQGTPGQTDFDDLIFEVNFTSGPEGVKLAAFSDDGVSIDVYDYVSGFSQSNVLDKKGVGQPLPDLDRSLKELKYFYEPGHRYRVRVHYLNTLYTGDGDIDGVLLLAFAGKIVPAWKVDILQAAAVVTGLKLPLVVGEPVNLSLKMTPAATDVPTYSWAVTGTTVKNYDHEAGTKTDLAGADMKNTSISFFWTTAGTWRASIAVNSQNVTKTANVDFIVAAPTGIKLKVKSTALVPPVAIRSGWLRFGDAEGDSGANGRGDCIAPTNGKGEIAFIQLISSKESTSWPRALPTGNDTKGYVLDYTASAPFYEPPGPDNFPCQLSDSPGSNVVGLTQTATKTTRTDTFKTYFMYKSNTVGSIWVPIGIVEWGWDATATQASGVWTFTSANPKTPGTVWNGNASSEFPEWTAKYK